MLASLAVILIISTSANEIERPGFFLFLSIFFPLITLLSQSQIFLNYQNGKNVFDIRIQLGIAVVVWAIAGLALGSRYYNAIDIAVYGLSIPLVFYSATATAAAQHRATHYGIVWVPLASSIFRVLSIYLLIDKVNPPVAFFISSFLYLLPPLVNSLWLSESDGVTEKSGSINVSSLLVFFLGLGLVFQWDKYALSAIEMDELVVAAGVYSTLILSPVSAIFATVFRAGSKEIFSLESAGIDWVRYRKVAIKFVLLCGLYGLFLSVLWENIVEQFFPYFGGVFSVAGFFLVALVIDRLSNLVVYMAGRRELYIRSGIARLMMTSVGFLAVCFIQQAQSLLVIYSLMCTMSVVWIIVLLRETR